MKKRCISFILIAAMFVAMAAGNVEMSVWAEGAMDGFVEVAVPNGDFENGETAWTFTGTPVSEDSKSYWKIFRHTGNNNTTNVYEICSEKNTQNTKNFTCSQTVTGLTPGTYKVSVQGSGGNDPGTGTVTLKAGGKSVQVNPAAWNNFITYETEAFEVGDEGTCTIEIISEVTGQYYNIDNVKLWYQGEAVSKTVERVKDMTMKIQTGKSFSAVDQAEVIYTDGSKASLPVVWNSGELSAVDTRTSGTYKVTGNVTVEGKDYPVILNVSVVNPSDLVQEVQSDAMGLVDFDENWQFYLATRTPEAADGGFVRGVKDAGDYTTAEIIAEDFDDMSWRTVDVPHDFSIEGNKVLSSVDSQAYLQGGLGWYRKKFTVPSSLRGKTIAIDFEGVYQNSVVYLNGKEVGSYPSGYTGFALDVTEDLKYGSQNVLVVKVQNMSPSGRWYTGSGITRPVHLVVDNSAHFNRNGITLNTPNLKAEYNGNGPIGLDVKADGYSDAGNSNARMHVSVYDASGELVATKQSGVTAINPSTSFSLSLTGANAVEIPKDKLKLWNPWNLGEPYLYKVRVDLYTEANGSADGYVLVDSEEIEYGFRWVEIAESTSDPDSGGLYVNGVYTKIQGVDLHHDSGALGAASYTDAYERQFAKLKAMGVNAYRTSHCPPSKEVIEVCRRNGILVVEEAFDGWGAAGRKATYDFSMFFFEEMTESWAGLKPNGFTSLPESETPYTGAKYVWSDWVIQEMVNRDKNEPSVIAWSIGNEVRGVGNKPAWYQPGQYDLLGVNPGNMNEYTEAVRLRTDIEAIDNTRVVVMGGDQERSVPEANSTWGYVNQVLDGYGLNYNTAKAVDGLISRYSVGDNTLLANSTKAFFFESESSSQTSSRGVYLDPQFRNTGINQTPGSRGGSNYDNDFASWTMSNEYGLKKDRDRKRFVGQFIWTGFDYLGEPTPYGVYPVGVASFGTIDTAGFEKDSFYLYQSQWTKEPMVHLIPQNWDEWQEGEEVEVWVNTNLKSAELFLNGRSLGKKSFDEKETAYGKKYYETSEKTQDDRSWGDASNPGGYSSTGAKLDGGELNSGKLHLTWNVPYEPGTLEVKAYDEEGNALAEDQVTTSSTPYTIQAKADKTVLKADGSSLSYVECTITDENGNMVPDADQLVRFSVSGAASIVGVDNGQQESDEIYKYDETDKSGYSERTAYNGKVLVIIKSEKTAGDALLTISAKDLKPVQVAFKVTEDGNGSDPAAPVINGTETSAEPVAVTLPQGKRVTLPSAVRVHYTSSAGDYSLMRKVTWGTMTNNRAKGTIEGSALEAEAVITEDANMQMDKELATNTALSGNSNIFRLKDLRGEAADKALATATFTGNVANYPNNMLDGNASTSWTNAYERGLSVLLPANTLSRKSDTVTFYWNDRKVMNHIALNFKENAYCAIPSLLKAEYWNGEDWAAAPGQVVQKNPQEPVTIQFLPVYTDKVRVYMENGTPFTESGNIEITEASVMFSSAKMDPQIVLNPLVSAQQGGRLSIAVQIANMPEDKTVTEISFAPVFDKEVFENFSIRLVDGAAGNLTVKEEGGKSVYTFKNEQGIPADFTDFAVIEMTVKAAAKVGSYQMQFTDLTAKDSAGGDVVFRISGTTIRVLEQKNPITIAKASLKNSIDAINSLNEKDYTVTTWKALMDELAAAKAVYEKENASLEEIQMCTAKLQSAIATLKAPGAEEYQELLKEIERLKEQIKNAGDSSTNSALVTELQKELENVKKELEAAKKVIIVTDKKKYTVKKGKTVKITAVASNGKKLSFKPKNKKIVKVTKKGVVKGLKKGSTKVVISIGTAKKTVTIKVK